MHGALKQAGLEGVLRFTTCYDDPSAVKDLNKLRWTIGVIFPAKEAENAKKVVAKISDFKLKEMKETDALRTNQIFIRFKTF
mmetsp:Transcript_6871/g.6163  ORF Transcript_6871/g.6163 Transcript_6871/m.6163 type:complete len:82 (+) Transcript_6871:254-499(+)